MVNGLQLLAAALTVALAGQPTTIFKFQSDEFWLNLHKFLYVLGRAQNRTTDAARAPVADAPLDSDRGLASLNELDRASWTDAVGAYARGLSRQDPTRDRTLALLEGRLGASGDSPNLAHDTVDDSLRTVLERAAPVYRKMWWASHRAGNRTWVEGTQKLVAMAGGPALQCITD